MNQTVSKNLIKVSPPRVIKLNLFGTDLASQFHLWWKAIITALKYTIVLQVIRYVSQSKNGLFYVLTADNKDNENMCYWWCLPTKKVSEAVISLASFDQGPSPHPLMLPATPLHAVTPSACTCQISLTSSAATPYDTPPYCPEPACHLTLHVFMHLSVWKARFGVGVGW